MCVFFCKGRQLSFVGAFGFVGAIRGRGVRARAGGGGLLVRGWFRLGARPPPPLILSFEV